ncbi:MAG: hypothetical protein ACYTFI_27220, partial [Planctomycetota bacterium]
GPTGLIITTTRVQIHHENETRMLSIPISDSPEQTRAVFRASAAEVGEPVDFEQWHALHEWLEEGEREVSVPFARVLAEVLPTANIRLRRDFTQVLTLIRAHALLHRASSGRDATGRIVATVDDYAVVRELLDDLLAHGLDVSVPPTVRETVNAVRDLKQKGHKKISLGFLSRTLDLDKSTVSRRVRAALKPGYLVNHETKRGLPMKIDLGETMPADQSILPDPKLIAEAMGCCSVAALPGGEGETPEEPQTAQDLESFDV